MAMFNTYVKLPESNQQKDACLGGGALWGCTFCGIVQAVVIPTGGEWTCWIYHNHFSSGSRSIPGFSWTQKTPKNGHSVHQGIQITGHTVPFSAYGVVIPFVGINGFLEVLTPKKDVCRKTAWDMAQYLKFGVVPFYWTGVPPSVILTPGIPPAPAPTQRR